MTTKDIIDRLSIGKPIENLKTDSFLTLNFKAYNFTSRKPIQFINCEFNNPFTFSNIDAAVAITFLNCTFSTEMRHFFKSLNIVHLKFENCHFGDVTLANISTNALQIVNCSSDLKILLLNIKTDYTTISWTDDKKRASFSIDSPEMGELDITSKENIRDFVFISAKVTEIEGGIQNFIFIPESFQSISLEPYFPRGIEHPEDKYNWIYNFTASHVSFSGALTINEMDINKLNFDSVRSSDGIIRFNELKINRADFNEVTVESFYWNQIDFSEYLTIERCDFSELKIANVSWLDGKRLSNSYITKALTFKDFLYLKWIKEDYRKRENKVHLFYQIQKRRYKKVELKSEKDYRLKILYKFEKWYFEEFNEFSDDDLIQLRYERETYRQLKATLLDSHNTIEALDFYRNEMRLYWKEIRINGGVPWHDRFLVFVQRVVSDFGQNWFMPLIWLFLIHFVLLLILFQGRSEIIINSNEKFGFLGEYFTTINPVHNTPDYVKSDGGKVIDFLMRIFTGYFIYHFIKASRKLGR